MTNNGFVGTNNGYPLTGQPALFPLGQAKAIEAAWSIVTMLGEDFVADKHPNLRGAIGESAWQWLFGSGAKPARERAND